LSNPGSITDKRETNKQRKREEMPEVVVHEEGGLIETGLWERFKIKRRAFCRAGMSS